MVHNRGISILLGFVVVFLILLMGSFIYWQIEQAKLNLDNARLKASYIEARRSKESLIVNSFSVGSDAYQLRIQNSWNEASKIKSIMAIKDGKVIYVSNPEISVYPLSSSTLDVKIREKPDTFIVITDMGNAFIANNPNDPSSSSSSFHVAYNLIYDPNEYQISASAARDYLIVSEGPLDMGQQIRVLGLLIEFDWKLKLLVPAFPDAYLYVSFDTTDLGGADWKKIFLTDIKSSHDWIHFKKSIVDYSIPAVGRFLKINIWDHHLSGNYVIYIKNINITLFYEPVS